MDETRFLLDTMTWSFTRLEAFYNCPYEWKLHYIDCYEDEKSFFSEYGTLMHRLLEKYEKGELSLFELNGWFEENYDSGIPHDAPPCGGADLRQSYFDEGIEYLNSIDLELDRYDILGAEKEARFKIAGKDFIGIIDLLLQDKETGEIVIADHKTSSLKLLKSGAVSKTSAEKFLSYKRQLYLYSIPVMEEYGAVSMLKWNMCRMRRWIDEPWNEAEFGAAVQWATDTISLIEDEAEWLPNDANEYYCRYLCGQRNNACEYKG